MAPARIQMERILCPVDFSPFSTRALERAVRLADWFEARVEALHVIPFLTPAGVGLPYFPAPLETTAALREQSEKDLAKLVEPFLGEGVPIETRVLQGDPWRVIVDETRNRPPDLLVMGTHGRSGFEHLLLGSVTEKVMRRAACPVMTIGDVKAAPRVGPLFRRILCPVDLTDASPRTLDMALSLAEENAARITLLHVVDNLPGAVGPGSSLAEPELGTLRQEIVEFAHERLRKSVPDEARDFCDVSERVETGTPWREVLRVAGEMEADLVVMGEHDHGAVGRVLFGSTSSHVVRRAACPVLVLREVKAPAPAQVAEPARALAGHAKGGGR